MSIAVSAKTAITTMYAPHQKKKKKEQGMESMVVEKAKILKRVGEEIVQEELDPKRLLDVAGYYGGAVGLVVNGEYMTCYYEWEEDNELYLTPISKEEAEALAITEAR